MMQDKTVLITGATNGIEEVAALELARAGAHVVIASRSAEKCAATVHKIKAQTNNTNVSYIAGDLSLLTGIRSVADEFLSRHNRLDVLLNNAGGVFTNRQVTSEGYEMTFALNHLSYFLLTHLLLDTLKSTAKEHGDARIVNVSSGAHQAARGIKFEDLTRAKGVYNAFGVYAETKLMNVLFTYELANRLHTTGVTANALHPGFVRTGFGKNNNSIVTTIFSALQIFALTPEQGAQTSVYLASSPEVKGVTGKYYTHKKPAQTSKVSHDSELRLRLWKLSEEIASIKIGG